MTIRIGPDLPFTPKPLPKTGTLKDLAEGFVWAFQQLTSEEQQSFREETMRRVYHDLSASEWEKDNPSRPYDLESRN
jgi:hypothetical protein